MEGYTATETDRKNFEEWWEKTGTQSTVFKEAYWDAWKAAIASTPGPATACC